MTTNRYIQRIMLLAGLAISIFLFTTILVPNPERMIKLPFKQDPTTLIVFAYAQGEYRDPNLEYFITKGGIINHPDYFYVFIGSGVDWNHANYTSYRDLINRFPNTALLERENEGFDSFGSKFSRFVLLNGSIRGPFLPVYASHLKWPEIFLDPFKNGNPFNVGLSGLTINCTPLLHIQSMLLAFTRDTFDIIFERLGCFKDKQETIDNAEVMYSQDILRKGKNLHSMMKYWQNHNFLDTELTAEKCAGIAHDPLFAGRYFGTSLHPLELVFMKTNRDLALDEVELYSNWRPPVPRISNPL